MNLSKVLWIQWIVDGVNGGETHAWTSQLASNRYRAIIPGQELIQRGHRVEMLVAAQWRFNPGDDGLRPDAIIVGKLLSGRDTDRFRSVSTYLIEQVKRAVSLGVPVLGDFNDDHFDHPLLGSHWRSLAANVTVCTVGSDAMAQRVRAFTDRPVVVVGDPIGSPIFPPRIFSGGSGVTRWVQSLMLGSSTKPRLKLVWYGNAVNWPSMSNWAEKLAALAEAQPFVIWVVTSHQDAIERFASDFNMRHHPGAMLELVPWGEALQWSVVNDADIVLIPSDTSDPKKSVKTGNRLTDALNAGRFVIASPLPAYSPFGEFVSLTDDPLAAVRRYLSEPDEALAKIKAGQFAAQSRASAQTIAAAWLGAIGVAVNHTPLTATLEAEQQEVAPKATEGTLPMRSLEQIHRGKKSKVSDKWQSYFAFYERNLLCFRDKEISLLEIGVQNGGSLEVWAEYFPGARALIGCDIDPKCGILRYSDSRIQVIVGDANHNHTAARIHAACPAYDIVIDDGSHMSDDIINSFLRYFAALKPGGVYIVEDTHTLYRESHQGGLLRRTTAHEFFKLMVDLVNHEHWEKDLSIKTLFSTFAPSGPLLPILQDGWIDGIEFRNSLICIQKAEVPTHKKLGALIVSGSEAIVHPSITRFQLAAPPTSTGTQVPLEAPSWTGTAAAMRADYAVAGADSSPAIRLNLGCGDKIISGYINVDVVESRAGRSPDVICDLHELIPFDADYADEVMAIHVVEHFWRWEIEAVLREWIRVLKPGGKLILECPNLQSACEAFLADPDVRSRPDKSGQTTMWVLYGDPSWMDPLMVHRWGYTPGSLANLLHSLGLVDVKQERAQYKLREPRDMRIVGFKSK